MNACITYFMKKFVVNLVESIREVKEDLLIEIINSRKKMSKSKKRLIKDKD